MNINSLTPTIGAEIEGVDLNQPQTEVVMDALYQALMEHLVIVFRNQDVRPEAHLAFAQSFGELDQPHPIYPGVDGYPQIVKLENHPDNPPDTDEWHTDLTFRQEPPFASVLRAVTIPPSGGDTLWRSLYAPYDSLSDNLKSELADMQALHDFGSFRNNYAAQGGAAAVDQAMAEVGSAIHPMIGKHPHHGRPYLFVNPTFTSHILGMTARESDSLLTYLFTLMDKPDYQIRLRWQTHTLTMWDNRVTQHYSVADYMPHYRKMHRITVVRDRRVGG